MSLNSIIERFPLNSEPVSTVRWGEGHIHETYLVRTLDHPPDYILQKINRNIFRNIPGMMRNIQIVCSHLKTKLTELPGHDPDKESLTLLMTKEGNTWYEDDSGNAWRMYVYIPGTFIFQKIEDPAVAFESGSAIGRFQALLSDLNMPLINTIPDFHNINSRISQYYHAKSSDAQNRIPIASAEIRFVEEHFGKMRAYYDDLKENAILHVTHNDTKVNNILFDKNNHALCLIDLDTVMPGYVHFDYGDALRTMASTALEDERNLAKVHFNIPVYEAFTSGYLQEAGRLLNQDEMAMLPFAPIYLTFIIGLRFLTDYLNGDIYFRIHYPGHNLVRARAQFRLVEDMEQRLI